MRQPTRTAVAVGTVVALAALAGCSQTAPPVEQESTITIGVPGVPPTIDQAVYPGESARWAHIMYGEGLLEYVPLDTEATSLQVPSESQLQPALAESFELAADSITMTLRDATSAAGNELTAEDVKWTFDRAIALEDSTGLFYLRTSGLDTADPVEIVDEKTVVFHGTMTPLALVVFLADQFAIIDSTLALEHATEADPWATEWLTLNSAGYGPYAVSSFTPDAELVLARNENYWRELPAYEEVIMTPATTETAVSLLQSGTVDYLLGVPLVQFASLAVDESVQTYAGPALAQDVLKLNQSFAPFQDESIRHAISLAVDRDALVQGPYQGVGIPAESVISRSIPGIDGPSEFYAFDLAEAQELMAGSAYPDGFSFTLSITQAEASSVDVSSLAVSLASQLSEIGIEMSVQTIASSADLRAAAREGRLDAWIRIENPAVADAAYLLNLIHVTGASSNFTGEADAEIDALVREAAALPFGEERDGLLNEAVDLWNERMYDVPLVQVQKTYAFGPNVCGFGPESYQQVRVQNLFTC